MNVRVKSEKKRNHGSATIEMTLLIPIILGVLYLYISFFVFFVDSARDMAVMVEVLYIEDIESKTITIQKTGSKNSVYVYENSGKFNKKLELHRYSGSAVENIRRWQLATDTVLSGGNP